MNFLCRFNVVTLSTWHGWGISTSNGDGVTVEYAARFWVALHFRPISIDWFEALELDDDVNWLIYWLHHTIKLEMYILRLKHMFRLLTFALIRFFFKKKTFCCLCFASLCTIYRMKILDFLHNMAHTLDDQWIESHNMCCAMSLRQCDNA